MEKDKPAIDRLTRRENTNVVPMSIFQQKQSAPAEKESETEPDAPVPPDETHETRFAFSLDRSELKAMEKVINILTDFLTVMKSSVYEENNSDSDCPF